MLAQWKDTLAILASTCTLHLQPTSSGVVTAGESFHGAIALQVSFNVLIPCMLFTKVAATLAESHHWTLFAIPVIAVIQVSDTCSHQLQSVFQVRLVQHIQRKCSRVSAKLGALTVVCQHLPQLNVHTAKPSVSECADDGGVASSASGSAFRGRPA